MLVLVISACGDTQRGGGSVAPPPAADAGAPSGGGGGVTADAGATADAGSTTGGSPDAGTSSGGGGGVPDAGGTPADAGTGGGSAGGGAPDAGPPAPQLLAADGAATTLALDANYVYWTSETRDFAPGRTSIRRVARTGGVPETMVDQAYGAEAMGLVVDRNAAYWTAWDCPTPCDYPGAGSERSLYRFNFYDRVWKLGPAYGQIALDDTWAYVRVQPSSGNDGKLMKYDRWAVVPGSVLADHTGYGLGVALDASNVYWTATGPGTQAVIFYVMPKGGGTIGYEKGEAPAHVAQRLFVTPDWFLYRGVGGSVDRTSRGNGAGEQLLWDAPNGTDFDVNGGRVFWNQSANASFPGCLGSANLDGTDGHCLDIGQHDYRAVRVDDTAVFFIRDGEVWRLPRQ